jgi:hypothetical protein
MRAGIISGRDLVSIWFMRRETEEEPRLPPGRGRILQDIENNEYFIVKKLAIKLNLMPEFLSLLGRAKVR